MPALSREVMLARVVRVRKRRMVLATTAAAVTAVLAVTAAAPLIGRAGQDEAGAKPRVSHQANLMNVIFQDPSHGYVVQERCTMLDYRDEPGSTPAVSPNVEITCRWALLKTADAGRTWQERPLPAEPATENTGFRLNPSRSLMFWAPEPGVLALGTAGRRYWTSADGGETWSQAPDQYEVPPEGWVSLHGTKDEPVFLKSAPDAEPGKWPIVTASDGSYWLPCLPLNQPPLCVTVSRDLGDTWQRLPVDPAGHEVTFVATYDGRTVFAGIGGQPGRLMRSQDGGQTWQAVPAPAQPALTGADVLALPNGDLLMTISRAEGGMVRIRPDGGIEEITGAPKHTGWMYHSGGVIVAPGFGEMRQDPQVPPVAWISSDNGATWIAVPGLVQR
jgi:photosystem II stability/assembly factor-like uncharacterized protein